MNRKFRTMDGREYEADSAQALFEAMRRQEYLPPATLERYLDLIQSRAVLGFDVRVDIGAPGEEIDVRCKRALASLMGHGWVRPARRGASIPMRAASGNH